MEHSIQQALESVPRIFAGRWRDSNDIYNVVYSFKSGAFYAERQHGSYRGRIRSEMVADMRYEKGLISRLDKAQLEFFVPRTLWTAARWVPGTEAAAIQLEVLRERCDRQRIAFPVNPWRINLWSRR